MKTLLKEAREKKGLKTREVASALKIDQALVSKFENGQRNPTQKQIGQLAELLDIDRDTLMVLWLKEKILRVIGDDPLGKKALQSAMEQFEPSAAKPDTESLQKLLDEMDALKHKFENLRGS